MNESCNWLIYLGGHRSVPLLKIAVLVPGIWRPTRPDSLRQTAQLDEAHPALGQSPLCPTRVLHHLLRVPHVQTFGLAPTCPNPLRYTSDVYL